MLKGVCVACACVLLASTAEAATIVTWQADGTVVRRSDELAPSGKPIAPPLGTPLSITLSFDPQSAFATYPGPAGVCDGVTVNVSGSLSIAGYTSPFAGNSQGFTHSNLPGTNCGSSLGFTQFGVFVPKLPDDSPFALPGGLLIVSYRDLLVGDTFPASPTPIGLALVTLGNFETGSFRSFFQAHADLHAIDQTTPVPEPATVTLFGLGLAAVARQARKRR